MAAAFGRQEDMAEFIPAFFKLKGCTHMLLKLCMRCWKGYDLEEGVIKISPVQSAATLGEILKDTFENSSCCRGFKLKAVLIFMAIYGTIDFHLGSIIMTHYDGII